MGCEYIPGTLWYFILALVIILIPSFIIFAWWIYFTNRKEEKNED